jgi:hypothetical protein
MRVQVRYGNIIFANIDVEKLHLEEAKDNGSYPHIASCRSYPTCACESSLLTSTSMLICKTASFSRVRILRFRSYYKLSRIIARSVTMSSSTFPPEELKAIMQEVATLLKERQETISVAETVRHLFP